MNKKILLGGILSVVILILVSFTSVVGYNSIESDKKLSPLFNIRSSRAIEKENEDLSCEYVGKGDGINLLISDIDSKTAIIQKVIDAISRLDDKIYSNLITQIITNLKNQEQMTDKEITDTVKALHYIRITPNNLKYDNRKSIREDKTNELISCNSLSCDWFPGCLILIVILDIIIISIMLPLWIIDVILGSITWAKDCTYYFPCDPWNI